MLFTSIQEINAIYPTSRWDDLDSLINPLNKVERTKLVNYLGDPLLRRLNEEYHLICQEEGGISAQNIDDSEPEFSIQVEGEGTERTFTHLTVDILRSCQEVILYVMLSNNIRILSSSLNRGGGFNSMTADDYDQSSDKQLDALKRETWRNAMDSVENLLRLLEHDAKNDRIYTELWKQSHYYYQQTDLLFTTAEDLSHYLDINESREQYITLVPVIRNAQDNYIAGRIGEDLLEDLISGEVEVTPNTESAFEKIRPRIYKHLKQALANYVAASSEYTTLRNYKDTAIKQANQAAAQAHGNGDMQLALASRIIVNHSDIFSDYISGCNSLQDIYNNETGAEWGVVATEPSSSCPLKEDVSSRSYSSLADFGGLHLN